MHTTLYEKNPQFHACWYAYRLVNVIAWYPLFDVAHANNWVNKLLKYLLQQFLPLFYVVFNIRCNNIRENSSEQQCLAPNQQHYSWPWIPGLLVWPFLGQSSIIWSCFKFVGLKSFIWFLVLFWPHLNLVGCKKFIRLFGFFRLKKFSSVEKYLLFHFFRNTFAKFLWYINAILDRRPRSDVGIRFEGWQIGNNFFAVLLEMCELCCKNYAGSTLTDKSASL